MTPSERDKLVEVAIREDARHLCLFVDDEDRAHCQCGKVVADYRTHAVTAVIDSLGIEMVGDSGFIYSADPGPVVPVFTIAAASDRLSPREETP